MTLNLIIKLRVEGILELSEDVFTEDVVVRNLQERQETEVFMGDVGTPLPDGSIGGIPEGFEPFHPDKIQAAALNAGPPGFDDYRSNVVIR